MSDFGEYEDGIYGRCRGCGEWTRHAMVVRPFGSDQPPWNVHGIAFCDRCRREGMPIDRLSLALASVLGDYHWRAFCDAWLAIGLAAMYVDEMRRHVDERMLGEFIGRVVRRGRRR